MNELMQNTARKIASAWEKNYTINVFVSLLDMILAHLQFLSNALLKTCKNLP